MRSVQCVFLCRYRRANDIQRRCIVRPTKQLAVSVLIVIGLSGCAYYGPAPGPAPYDYYYYPSASVYFNIHSGYYDYYSDGHWRRSKTLPPNIHLSPQDRHHVQTREPEPYHHDNEYRERFKPNPNFRPDRDQDRQARDFDRRSHDEYEKGHGRR